MSSHQQQSTMISSVDHHDAASIVALDEDTKSDYKAEVDHVEDANNTTRDAAAIIHESPPALRSKIDNLAVFTALKTYRFTALICMAAAFSASLDGYQGHLNSSIVSNKGFIRQFAPKGSKILDAKWVALWGGTSSAGQTIAQFAMVYVTDYLGRKAALWTTFALLTGSIFAESFVSTNGGWLAAKLLSGIGVGAMQGTLPMYISELSPTQLRGLFVNAYTFWYVVGQLMGPVCLQILNEKNPYDYKTAIYTQFGMIGGLLLIYLVLPESPWWLVSKGKNDRARKTLRFLHKGIAEYDVEEHLAIMNKTIDDEREKSRLNESMGPFAIFQGINGWRLLIALWPKLMQQFVGLSVFNTYSTYFFQVAGNNDPFLVTVILACVQMISMLMTMTLVDGWGRRPLTIIGYSLTVLADFAMGATGTQDVKHRPRLGKLLIFWACLATFSTTSASAIGYAYLAEVPKQDFRAKSAGWGLAIPNLFSIMFNYTVPLMLNGPPKWGIKTGFFFGCTGLCTVIVGWFIMPELARRTPAEIDEMFSKRVNPRHFKGYVTDVEKDLQHATNQEKAMTTRTLPGETAEEA